MGTHPTPPFACFARWAETEAYGRKEGLNLEKHFIKLKTPMPKLRWMVLFVLISIFHWIRPGWADETKAPLVMIDMVINSAGLCDKAYDPPVVTVKAGTTVIWINQDIVTHTLVSGEGNDPCHLNPLPPEKRAIDGGLILPGRIYRMTFQTPGVYLYTCHLPTHRMQGKVIVVP
jgi:plastocyanin